MLWSNKHWLLKWFIVLEKSHWNCNGEKIKIHFIENWKRLNMMRDCECLHTITSLIRLLNVVCVISKSKLIGGAYNIHILYTCTNTAFFFLQHSWLYYTLHRERDKKKLFKHVCVELRSEPIDCWYLYRHISVLLMYYYSDTKMLVTGFSFILSFFFCVCELNKMLVSYIFIVENLVWLCWFFFIKWQIPKCLNFYIIIQMCSPSQLCVCGFFF